MPVEWSGSGPQLLMELDRSAPLRAQVEEQLRTTIQTGRLVAGERMPSTRALATYLRLSRGVIQECYAQLQAEGYLTSRAGSATRVATTISIDRPTPAPLLAAEAPPLLADFPSGVPDLGLAPRADWAWAVREVCRTAADAEFDYGDAQGAPRLREVLTGYLRRVRAVDTCAANVVVCGGFQQGLGLVLRVLGGPVAVEDPGSVGNVTRAAGGATVPVPVDEQGIDVGALAASGARVVVVTPAHQWPTGVVLAPARRHALVAWARECDGYIVEDDYDAEFRYDREPVGSLQGLAPDRVIGLGTVSKSLAPALRLGWAVLPSALATAVVAAKAVADRGTPQLDQLALATLFESGRYDRHLRRMRTEYAARRDVLVSALTRLAPSVRVTGLAAGFHAIAHLPAGVAEADVIAAARERRVGLYGMSTYRSTHDPSPAQLVLGFGNTSQHEIRTGIGLVADLLSRR